MSPDTPTAGGPTLDAMATDDAWVADAMAKVRRGEIVEGVTVHISHTPTEADWDALDPNSYETTCAACDTPYDGQFGPDHSLATPCPNCGSMETAGGIGSPAGGMSLLLRSDF